MFCQEEVLLSCCSPKFSRFFWTPLLGPYNTPMRSGDPWQLWSLVVTDADNVVTAVACYARRYNEQLFEQKHSLSLVNRALGRISSTCLSLYLSSSFIHIYQPDFHCICLFLLFTFVNMSVHVFVLFIYSHLSTWLSLYLSCSFIHICQHDCHCICLVLCLGWGWMRPVTSRALFCPLLGLRLELPLKPIVAPRLNSPATHSMASSHVW